MLRLFTISASFISVNLGARGRRRASTPAPPVCAGFSRRRAPHLLLLLPPLEPEPERASGMQQRLELIPGSACAFLPIIGVWT
jgi:hypothetical protein